MFSSSVVRLDHHNHTTHQALDDLVGRQVQIAQIRLKHTQRLRPQRSPRSRSSSVLRETSGEVSSLTHSGDRMTKQTLLRGEGRRLRRALRNLKMRRDAHATAKAAFSSMNLRTADQEELALRRQAVDAAMTKLKKTYDASGSLICRNKLVRISSSRDPYKGLETALSNRLSRHAHKARRQRL